MKPKILSFCTWIRAVSAIMIMLCHYFQQSGHVFVRMFAQFLNIGVFIFFFLSGFLAGYHGVTKPHRTWYKKRFKRIFGAFWLFLLILAVVHITSGLRIATSDWLMLALGLQGSVVGVWGAEHTWFISVLLLCYLITPVISIVLDYLFVRCNTFLASLCLLLLICAPILYALCPAPWTYTMLTPISFYAIAFTIGNNYDPHKSFPKHRIGLCICVVIFAFSLRLIVRTLFDGSILYDRVIVPYTQFLAAGAIFFLFTVSTNNKPVPFLISFISGISFEIYLYHYMFTVGPVSLFGTTSSWLTDCIVVTGATIIVSLCCHKLVEFINQWLLRKMVREAL